MLLLQGGYLLLFMFAFMSCCFSTDIIYPYQAYECFFIPCFFLFVVVFKQVLDELHLHWFYTGSLYIRIKVTKSTQIFSSNMDSNNLFHNFYFISFKFLYCYILGFGVKWTCKIISMILFWPVFFCFGLSFF